ncbi:MAG: electron transfer flavoprotein subunit beta/FixA family protein [Chloroflexota bacterium]|nr:electron transfer flavoprotein subunit beta/FixA family protein [Chloroflexota bacterium]
MPNMIVCVKQIPDPEAPAGSFRVDEAANAVVPAASVSQVVSPFDEQAVEAALRLKDEHGGTITAVSLGKDFVMDVIKKPLAMGSDELVLLQDPAFEGGDSRSTAYALAMAIKKIGDFDIVFCGRQAADWDAGQVGSGIAEFLGVPSVTVAKKVEWLDGKVKVERVVSDGYEVIEVSPPLVITVSNELGEPRYPKLKGIMAASKKQVPTWAAADIAADASQAGAAGARIKLLKVFQPVKEGKCEIIEGDSPEEAAAALALKLREVKLV